jgi:hypothetical protein
MKTGFKIVFLCFVTLVFITSGIQAQNVLNESLIAESMPVHTSLSKAQMDSIVADSKRKSKFQWSLNPGYLNNVFRNKDDIDFYPYTPDFNSFLNVLFGLKAEKHMLGIGPGFQFSHFNRDRIDPASYDLLDVSLMVSNRFLVPLTQSSALDFFINTGITFLNLYYGFEYYSYNTYSAERKLLANLDLSLNIPISGGIGISLGTDNRIQLEMGFATYLLLTQIRVANFIYYNNLSVGVNVSF